MAYSQGFSPRPRISFGLALATGQESVAEYLDVDLRASAEELYEWAADMPERLSAVLPDGMAVSDACPLRPGAVSLQEAVTSCTWEFALTGTDTTLAAAWAEQVRSAESLPLQRERKGRTITSDVRTAVGDLHILDASAGDVLVAELGTKPRAVRPAEFLRLIAPPLAAGRVRRFAPMDYAGRRAVRAACSRSRRAGAGRRPTRRGLDRRRSRCAARGLRVMRRELHHVLVLSNGRRIRQEPR